MKRQTDIDSYVIVLDKAGKPLMPTKRFGKVRRMLKSGLATKIGFFKGVLIIQLNYEPETHEVQEMILGCDIGKEHIGFSVTNSFREYFAMEVQGRSKEIKDNLTSRRECRIGRRSKLRSRAVKFLNRKRSEGYLAPSVKSVVDLHTTNIDRIMSLFPIKKIILETAKFDTQRLKNPDIKGEEYQQGPKYGFENTKSYVRFRDGYKCQICGKKEGILEVHHITYRENGGTDVIENLITLCSPCHKKVHKGKLTIPEDILDKVKYHTMANEIQTSIISAFVERYVRETYETKGIEVDTTFGYITKSKRIENHIQKSHSSDAYCIAGNLSAEMLKYEIYFQQRRRHKRKLATYAPLPRKKGKKSSGRRTEKELYKIEGFGKGDTVRYQGDSWVITALRNSKFFGIKNLKTGESNRSVSYKLLKLIKHGSRHYITKRDRILMLS